MRIATKLFLLVTAVATITFVTSAASAQVVVSEEPGDVCGDVAEVNDAAVGGCAVHVASVHSAHTGGNQIMLWVNGSVVTICTVEFSANIGGDGSGLITNQQFGGGTPPCVMRPCYEASATDAGLAPWSMQIIETGPGTFEGQTTFCIRPFNSEDDANPCSIVGQATETPTHNYRLELDDAECNAGTPDAREYDGALEIEGLSDGIEISH